MAEYEKEYGEQYQRAEKQTRKIYNSDSTVELPVGEDKEKLAKINKKVVTLRNNISELKGVL